MRQQGGHCCRPIAIVRFGAIIALTLITLTSRAESAEGFFDRGVQAVQAGDNENALQHFLNARHAGLDSSSLYYNLGVTYYHLGQYEQAKEAFQQLTRSAKTAALAYYNLGLIAHRLDDDATAIAMFDVAEQKAATDKLRQLSQMAKQQIRSTVAASEQQPTNLWIEVGAGHDDNALLVPDGNSSASDLSDSFIATTVFGSFQLSGNDSEGLELQGLIQQTRYHELNDFDYDAGLLSLQYGFHRDRWLHRIAAMLRKTRFGGDDFDSSSQISMQAERPFDDSFTLILKADYETVVAADDFAFLDGDRYAVGAKLLTERHWQFAYTHEVNRRDNLQTQFGEFFSFSPTREILRAIYKTSLYRRFGGQIEAQWYDSRYDGTDSRFDGTTYARKDTRSVLSLTLFREFDSDWRLNLEIHHTDNESNFDDYDYKQSVVTLSIDKNFEFER